MADAVPAFAELAETAGTQYPGAPDHILFWEIQRQLVNRLVGGLIEGTAGAAKEAAVETVEDVRALPHRLAQLTPEAAEINRQIHSVLVDLVYSYAQLVQERSAAVERMAELFSYLLEHPERVSPGYQERLHESPVHRVVCDYIAGMTDSYLTRTHKELVRESVAGD